MTLPRARRVPLSSRWPALEARTLTVACFPAAIEKVARPRVIREVPRELVRRCRAVSFVRPEQRPMVPAGHASVSATTLRAMRSLVTTSLTPAKAGVGSGVVDVGLVEVGLVELGVGAGGEAVVKVWSIPVVTPPELVATSRSW